MLGDQHPAAPSGFLNSRPCDACSPRPLVTKPKLGQHVQRGRLATAIDGGDAHQNVLDVAFGVLDRDVEVLVVGEDARIDQFVLARVAAAARIFLAQVAIREGALRIPVEALEVCVRRKRVEVPPVFFDVLAVIALMAPEAVQAFLDDLVVFVPKRRRNA